jgi:tRNA(His) 5'-end guanylyltransferase
MIIHCGVGPIKFYKRKGQNQDKDPSWYKNGIMNYNSVNGTQRWAEITNP